MVVIRIRSAGGGKGVQRTSGCIVSRLRGPINDGQARLKARAPGDRKTNDRCRRGGCRRGFGGGNKDGRSARPEKGQRRGAPGPRRVVSGPVDCPRYEHTVAKPRIVRL